MKDFVIRALVAGGIMGVVDFLWLTIVAKNFYKSQIGPLLLEKPNMVAALAFYVVYIVGVTAFVIMPAFEKQSWPHALGYGALFGLVAYATYDLTNLATLKGFTTKLVAVDLLWGACLTALVSLGTYGLIRAWTH